MKGGVISPQDWGLPVYSGPEDRTIPGLDLTTGEITRRMRLNLYEWLPRQVDPQTGAICGFYRAIDGYREPPQTVNLIASWLCMAGYDRFGDQALLKLAVCALEFYYQNLVVSHPMSVICGGARDGAASAQVWTKFSAEFIIGALGLYQRTGQPAWLERAVQSGNYLIQAARHHFSPRYHLDTGRWDSTDFGWDSWGRAVEACLGLEQATGEPTWRQLAYLWGEHGLAIQASNGCYYLIDEEYFNTDLAADELRALAFLFEMSDDERYLQAAIQFARWLMETQRPDGAWPLTIDRDHHIVIPTVGPGDMPNLAIALLRLHELTAQPAYLDSARQTIRYSFSRQNLPESGHPYDGDPNVIGGFWSWDPYYDYSLSADQATHHIRGWMFLVDYLAAQSLI